MRRPRGVIAWAYEDTKQMGDSRPSRRVLKKRAAKVRRRESRRMTHGSPSYVAA